MRACAVCGKSYQMGGTRRLLRGHYNPTKRGKKKANLQWTKALRAGGRALVCTRCLKTLTKKGR
ncbi:MAG TPA: 50S ribosomal protein L28 [Candidatus Paceibacterota bacterium]|nr:50S ribosomal protein L28 [Candidatus Paceibacterota bacterium]